MASQIIGRTCCPFKCGHDAAHVKIKTDKEPGKTAYPYVYCPGCGMMAHARNERQGLALAAISRPEAGAAGPVHAPTPTPTGILPPVPDPVPNPAPTPEPTAPPTPKPPAGLFDSLWSKK